MTVPRIPHRDESGSEPRFEDTNRRLVEDHPSIWPTDPRPAPTNSIGKLESAVSDEFRVEVAKSFGAFERPDWTVIRSRNRVLAPEGSLCRQWAVGPGRLWSALAGVRGIGSAIWYAAKLDSRMNKSNRDWIRDRRNGPHSKGQ